MSTFLCRGYTGRNEWIKEQFDVNGGLMLSQHQKLLKQNFDKKFSTSPRKSDRLDRLPIFLVDPKILWMFRHLSERRICLILRVSPVGNPTFSATMIIFFSHVISRREWTKYFEAFLSLFDSLITHLPSIKPASANRNKNFEFVGTINSDRCKIGSPTSWKQLDYKIK